MVCGEQHAACRHTASMIYGASGGGRECQVTRVAHYPVTPVVQVWNIYGTYTAHMMCRFRRCLMCLFARPNT